MLLSAVSVLVVAQSSSEIPEGLMNNPVLETYVISTATKYITVTSNHFVQSVRCILCVCGCSLCCVYLGLAFVFGGNFFIHIFIS